MSKRIAYIDIARGIGILLVVMGHNDFAAVSPFFYKLIYSFHMPLFFFLSGMFFKPQQSFFELLKRRFETLLKPYLVTIVMIYVVSLSFSRIDLSSASVRLLKALYANGHYIDWVQLWFLPHLFLINIFAFCFFWFVKRSHIPWLKWILLVAVQVVGVLVIDKFWPFDIAIGGRHFTLFGLPLSLDLVLVSGFFFILGSEVNRSDLTKILAQPLVSLVSGLGLLAMVTYLPDIIDFNTRLFASLPINSLEAVLGIIFILSISHQIEKIALLSSILRYIGQASLIILIFHVPVQEAWGAKMMAIFNNQILSYWIAYPAGVLVPIFLYQYIIQPNPIVRSWFGLPIPHLDQPTTPAAQTKSVSN